MLFKKFKEIIWYLKLDFSTDMYTNTFQFDKEELKVQLKEWRDFYLKLLKFHPTENKKNDEHMTPYIHIFVYHIPDLISKFHNLNAYSTQALEKSHDFTKAYLMRNTNRKKNEFLKQLFEKENRIEFINLKGSVDELFDKINLVH